MPVAADRRICRAIAAALPTPPEALEPRRLFSTYYVSSSGSDGADGLSPQTAWQSIGRVNKVDLNAGAQVLFQGGSTFTATPGSGAGGVVADPGFDNGLASWTITRGTSA